MDKTTRRPTPTLLVQPGAPDAAERQRQQAFRELCEQRVLEHLRVALEYAERHGMYADDPGYFVRAMLSRIEWEDAQ